MILTGIEGLYRKSKQKDSLLNDFDRDRRSIQNTGNINTREPIQGNQYRKLTNKDSE